MKVMYAPGMWLQCPADTAGADLIVLARDLRNVAVLVDTSGGEYRPVRLVLARSFLDLYARPVPGGFYQVSDEEVEQARDLLARTRAAA